MSTRQVVQLSTAIFLMLAWVTIAATWADAPSNVSRPQDPHRLLRLDRDSRPGSADEDDNDMDCPWDESDEDDEIESVVVFARQIRGD
jgi:hypothetical protein